MTDTRPSINDQWHQRVVFESAFGRMNLHNHLNHAYHAAGMYRFAPPNPLMWRIPAILVPRKVRDQVNGDEQIEQLRTQLAKAREQLVSVRERADREVTSVVNCDTVPYHHLAAGITGGKNDRKPGYMTSWSYTFNPYQVATTLLAEQEVFVEQVARSSASGFTKLSRLWRRAKRLDDSVGLVVRYI